MSGSGTATNVGSLTLTKGIWMLYGKGYIGTAGTTRGQANLSISTTSATHDSTNLIREANTANNNSAAFYWGTCMKYVQTTGTTVYLVMDVTYTGSAPATVGSVMQFEAIRIGV